MIPVPLDPASAVPLDLDSPEIDTPAVLIDLDIVDANIDRMAASARRQGVALRPHVKTHKSARFARAQSVAGAVGITVSSSTEAEEFAAAGFDDLVLAYPVVGRRKLDRLLPLIDAGVVTLLADSIEVAEGYRALGIGTGRTVPVLIEVDSGMHRSGVLPSDVGGVGAEIARMRELEIAGILTHAGHAHNVATRPEIAAVARDEARAMQQAREGLESRGIPVPVVSAGSTITAPYLSAADGITEIRPGTYVFNDLRTLESFACTPDQIAATMLTTIVSVRGRRATIDAGNKSLTMTRTPAHEFGHLLGRSDAVITHLSEEHGVLTLSADDPAIHVGQRVRAVPVHVCVWMDLQTEVYGMRGGRILERIAVDAMRHSL